MLQLALCVHYVVSIIHVTTWSQLHRLFLSYSDFLTIYFNRSVALTGVFFLAVTATTFSSAAIVWCFVLPDDHSPDRTVLQTRGNSLKNKRRISLHNYVKIINRKNWPWLERTLFIGWTSYLLFLLQIRSHKSKYQVCFTCWRNLWNCDYKTQHYQHLQFHRSVKNCECGSECPHFTARFTW